MAKTFAVVSALCFLALASLAYADDELFAVNGQVYCDPCRVEFKTKLSRGIEGVPVRLQCWNRDNGTLTVSVDTVTGKDGNYNLNVSGDHEEEICEVGALDNPDSSCNNRFINTDKARVLLTENNGVKGKSRYANPLGFKTAETAAECKEVLSDLDMTIVSY